MVHNSQLFFTIKAKSMTHLQEETMNGDYDAILHVGDFAYDMINVCLKMLLNSDLLYFCIILYNFQDDGKVGDVFMNQIESIAAYVPYMTCVGNHENA